MWLQVRHDDVDLYAISNDINPVRGGMIVYRRQTTICPASRVSEMDAKLIQRCLCVCVFVAAFVRRCSLMSYEHDCCAVRCVFTALMMTNLSSPTFLPLSFQG